MKLQSLYDQPNMWWLPYKLLAERESWQNISHETMPSWEDHCDFVRSRPYAVWDWFADSSGPAGCIYLTTRREIGIGVLKVARSKGLAKEAIREIMARHPGQCLANIAPDNLPSKALFESLGFVRIQETYRL
jgi:RimJ/RimL family protein N-acetyltransferase